MGRTVIHRVRLGIIALVVSNCWRLSHCDTPSFSCQIALLCSPICIGQVTDEEIAALYSRQFSLESVPKERWIAETENAFAFRDRNPQAPVHVLGVPKRRVPTVLQAPDALLGEMLGLVKRVAEQEGIAREGFRTVINTHPQSGQGIYHLHIHVLGGRQMKWPPG
ncbi:HIT domain-containing protein [Azotobacter salinestris]|uniref:HIT domain-containing protein n=1 Tax=Azotobacter salinestris TaxID=69964 RepID=UPI0032DF7755